MMITLTENNDVYENVIAHDTLDGGLGTDTYKIDLRSTIGGHEFRSDQNAEQQEIYYHEWSLSGRYFWLVNVEVLEIKLGEGVNWLDFSETTGLSYHIESGSNDDRIYVGHGADTIYAGDGNDDVMVHGDNDTVFGGAGRDTLSFSIEGSDDLIVEEDSILERYSDFEVFKVVLGSGDDIYHAGSATEYANGGLGFDIFSGDYSELSTAGIGSNGLYINISGDIEGDYFSLTFGSSGQENYKSAHAYSFNSYIIIGTELNDRMSFSAGADTIYGEKGNDYIAGKGGSDFIYGGDGKDRIDLDHFGSTQAFGGNGDDIFGGLLEADTVIGGSGVDLVMIDDTYLETTLRFSGAIGNATGIEGLDIRLNGTDNNLYAKRLVIGNIMAGAGFDLAHFDFSGQGDLAISEVHFYAGKFTIHYGNGHKNTELTTIGFERFHIKGSEASDSLLNHYAKPIFLDGFKGNDTLKGGFANDTLLGGANVDQLYGNKGNDRLDGGSNTDFLNGDAGDDRLKGGRGADYFIFEGFSSSGKDLVVDFSGKDVIYIGGDLDDDDVTITTKSNGTLVAWDKGSVLLWGYKGDVEFLFNKDLNSNENAHEWVLT